MTKIENSWWTPWRAVDDVIVLKVDLTSDGKRESLALSLLDEMETGRYHKFLSIRARREFVLCRAALRVILAERLDCSNEQLSFGHLEHGKPYAKISGRVIDQEFNVSHSDQLGLIAISNNARVGVDIEQHESQRDFAGIGGMVYGPGERRMLAAFSGTEKMEFFYRVWSMKEALIKALGTGFSMSPTKFEIPSQILNGAKSCKFSFPYLKSSWRLMDMGEQNFAAALAYQLNYPD